LNAKKGEFAKPSKSAEEVGNFTFIGLRSAVKTKSNPGDTPGNPELKRATLKIIINFW
jgi:hypothetical protein